MPLAYWADRKISGRSVQFFTDALAKLMLNYDVDDATTQFVQGTNNTLQYGATTIPNDAYVTPFVHASSATYLIDDQGLLTRADARSGPI